MTSRRYTVELVRDAEKDLKKLRPWTEQATRQLLRLEEDPMAGHPLTGVLRGTRALEFTLKGGGAYRAVYTVLDDDRVCVVLIVGPHENIYLKAERRYRAWLRRADLPD
jgi:mRNA-degrading endonuclease RelE of RelBE toxin-antitoxin system